MSTSIVRQPAEKISLALLIALISTAIPEAITELTCPEKSLVAAFVIVGTTPLAFDGVKFALNQSGLLKKNFDLRVKFVLAEQIILACLTVPLFMYGISHEKFKGLSPLGYNAIIMIVGAALKLGEEFVVPYMEKKKQELSRQDIFIEYTSDVGSNDSDVNSTDDRESAMPNATPLHIARFLLLFCATKVGGEFFDGMHIPLSEVLKTAGLTNYFALVIFSTLFNELAGSTLFYLSNKFKALDYNFISQIVTLVIMTAFFQNVKVSNKENIVNFTGAFAIAFFVHLVLDLTKMNKKLNDGIVNLPKSISAQLARGYAACSTPGNGYSRLKPIVDETTSTVNQSL